jgi:MFS family permease
LMPKPDDDPPVIAGRVSYSIAYKRSVVLLLTLAYTLNSADRTLISIIGQPLKLDLKLSDAQLGLLVGTAFATLYAFSGLPIARLAERFNRVAIISIALTVWSSLTALCGIAASFPQLLMIRMGVGVGEAGCTPPAHSLISDYVEPARRSTALSIYSSGISLGYLFSAIVGGYVALHHGWRAACMVIGLPGVVVAIGIRRLIDEPLRGNAEPLEARIATLDARDPRLISDGRRSWVGAELAEMAAVARILLFKWPIANIVIGVTVATFASQGSYAFVPAYFNRAFGLDYATIGLVSGLAGGVSVGLGLVAGGFVTDLLGTRSAKWYALVPAIGLATSMPLYVLAFLQADWKSTALLLAIPGFFQYVSFGPTFGIVQNVVDTRRRATATAVIYVLLTVIGLGCGPPFTGWMIDRFAEFNYNHLGADTVARSFDAMRGAAANAGASFELSCPAGKGLVTASAAAKAACESTLALSSREGIIVTVLLYGWAAIHYLLGAIGLSAEMRAAALRNAAVAADR